MTTKAKGGPGSHGDTPASNDAQFQSTIDAMFRSDGARPPLIRWSPEPKDISHPIVASFGAKCRLRSLEADRVLASAMPVDALGVLTGWAMVLDVEGTTGPFRYAHYGRHIAEHFGRDMTGKTTDAFGGHISEFFTSLYREVVRRKEWVLSEHEPPSEVFVRSWQRLIVPLFDENGEVVRLAVANVAENELRAGLDLISEPVFVLSEASVVLYANPAAQRFFQIDPMDMSPRNFDVLTGIDFDMATAPEQLLLSGDGETKTVLASRGAVIERLEMTVRAAQHRRATVFVVALRVIDL